MLLKSVKLHNIRSYVNEEIEFPEGRVLLSGDIGSGKSTILLAIEFALFGIMKGDLSGEALLRHGKKDGYVEMKMEIGGKEVTISRALKKSAAGVKQDSGYIISGGRKKEGTATELKAWVLEMLGYPKELLTKTKGLVYRYTVYTPQEEMKLILFEDREQRLNTLRRVFNIDKYRRIRENALIYARELREQTKEIEGYVSDTEEKKKQAAQRHAEAALVGKKIEALAPRLKEEKACAEMLGKKAEEAEKEIRETEKLKKELALCELEIRHMVSQSSQNRERAELLKRQVSEIEKESGKAGAASLEEAKNQLREKEALLRQREEKLIAAARKSSEFQAAIRSSDEIKNKISGMDKCPMCMQDVSPEHKHRIAGIEGGKSENAAKNLRECSAQEKAEREGMQALKKEIESLRERERNAIALREKTRAAEEKKASIREIEESQERIKKGIGSTNARKIKINEEMGKKAAAGEGFLKAREEHQNALRKFHETDKEYSTLLEKQEGISRLAGEINAEIAKKEEAGKRLAKIRGVHHWIEEFFTGLTGAMERQVMANVFQQFSTIFQDWFRMLLEDEAISSRLDDTFTPVIVQNGFETGIENLSGGEKTSCALAYRLALNKVINELITEIKTKDLIILDEPTDGFSTEQLDKVRDVLDELNMKQVIIVSHEQKIESFVDSVIRIQKNEHTSQVASPA